MSILHSIWKKYGQILLLGGIVLLSFWIGFRFGEIKTKNNIPINLSLNNLENANPAQEKINLTAKALERQGIDLKLKQEQLINDEQKQKCLFVASKKSHKYHTNECKYGKKIKLENRICFETEAEAKKQKYIPAKGCLGKK